MSPLIFGQHLVLMHTQGLVVLRRRAHQPGQMESWGSLADELRVVTQDSLR